LIVWGLCWRGSRQSASGQLLEVVGVMAVGDAGKPALEGVFRKGFLGFCV
jgi:hypothetical protein